MPKAGPCCEERPESQRGLDFELRPAGWEASEEGMAKTLPRRRE